VSQSCIGFTTSSSQKHLDSGHGGQTKDLDGDEGDGFDEGQYVDRQNITKFSSQIF
jgi:hypothetical protein